MSFLGTLFLVFGIYYFLKLILKLFSIFRFTQKTQQNNFEEIIPRDTNKLEINKEDIIEAEFEEIPDDKPDDKRE